MKEPANHPEPETTPAPGLRISLMGSEGSGKTCFFAGLAWLGSAARSGGIGVVGRNEASQVFVNELRDTLARNDLPQSTRKTDDLALDVLFGGARLGIDIENFAGEEFRTVGTELRSGSPLFEKFVQSQYLILFLDIENDVDHEVQANAERLDAMLNLLSTEVFCNGRRKLAVVLTKSDLRGFTGPKATSAAARGYLQKRQPGLLEKIEHLGYDKRFFFLAPIGRSSLSEGQPPAPFGYEALFGWLVGDLRRERFFDWIRNWLRKHRIPIAASVAAIVLATGIGLGFYLRRYMAGEILDDPNAPREEKYAAMRYAPQNKRDAYIDKEIKEIEDGLPSVDSLSVMDDLQGRIATLKGKGTTVVNGRLSDLDRRLRERREDIHIDRMIELERQKDIDGFRKNRGNYYKDDHSSRRHETEVQLINARLDDAERRRKRVEIRSLDVKTDLKAKCDLIDKFFSDDSEVKSDAARAVTVARLFLANNPYQIEIRNASGLSAPHQTRLVLSNLGPGFRQQEETADTKASAPQWNKKVDFRWKPGDRIRIEWLWNSQVPLTPATTIGTKDFPDPWTALLDALGGVDLNPVTGIGHAALHGKTPRATITCSAFQNPSKDKELFRLFIFPGTYWQD